MKDMYVDYLKQKSPSERMIRRDIARTFPEHDFFKEKNGVGQESLFNVMKVISGAVYLLCVIHMHMLHFLITIFTPCYQTPFQIIYNYLNSMFQMFSRG